MEGEEGRWKVKWIRRKLEGELERKEDRRGDEGRREKR